MIAGNPVRRRHRVFVAGVETGTEYAAYLGLNYPEEFQGAALLHGGWSGPLSGLMQPSRDRNKRIAFFVAAVKGGKDFPAIESKSEELGRAGYEITLEPVEKEVTLAQIQERMAQWFREISEPRARGEEKGEASRKSVYREMVHNMFEG